MNIKTPCLFIIMCMGLFIGYQGFDSTAWAKFRIGRNADIQADEKTVREIEAAFIRAEAAMNAGDVDSLMELYSEDYHFGVLAKHDMKTIWEDFFRKYHRVESSHSFSRLVVRKGNPLTAEITCTGSLWGTSNEKDERVNLTSWLGDIHFMVYENGGWRIRGQDRKSPKISSFEGAPPRQICSPSQVLVATHEF